MANAEFFLKIDTIDGESTKKGFESQIEIAAFNWGAQQPYSGEIGAGGGGGKVTMQPFQFTTKVNKASPKLLLACATGQHIKTAVLSARKAGGAQEVYLKYTLSNVLVTSYQTAGSDGTDPLPVDSFTLGFDKIQVEYKPQDEKGAPGPAVTTGYDLKAMAKV